MCLHYIQHRTLRFSNIFFIQRCTQIIFCYLHQENMVILTKQGKVCLQGILYKISSSSHRKQTVTLYTMHKNINVFTSTYWTKQSCIALSWLQIAVVIYCPKVNTVVSAVTWQHTSTGRVKVTAWNFSEGKQKYKKMYQ